MGKVFRNHSPVDNNGGSIQQDIVLRSAQGFTFLTISTGFVRLGGFIVTLGVAKFLGATELGHLTTAFIVLNFGPMALGSGIVIPLVVSSRPANELVAAGLAVSLCTGVLLSSIFVLFGATVAALLGNPSAGGLIKVGALGVMAFFTSITPRALLQRNLRFNVSAVIEVIASLSYVIMSLGFIKALRWEVQSVVVAYVVQNIIASALYWAAFGFESGLSLSTTTIKEVVSFTRTSSANGVIQYLSSYLDNMFVLRFAGTSSLGVYALIYNIAMEPAVLIGNVAGRVILPSLASVKGDNVAVKRRFSMSISTLTVTVFPPLAFLAATGSYFLSAVFGSEWKYAVGPLAVLTIAAAARALNVVPGNLLYALNRPRQVLAIGAIGRVVQAGALACGVGVVKGGIMGAAIAMSVVSVIMLVPVFNAVKRDLEVRFWRATSLLVRWTIPSILVFCTALLVSKLKDGGFETLILQGIASGFVFVVAVRITHGQERFQRYLQLGKAAVGKDVQTGWPQS